MILLDTNVVSEMMKPVPADVVHAWLDRQSSDTLFISTITQAEIQFGIAVMPGGQRKQRLEQLYSGIERLFAGRILPFDSAAALVYADLAAAARSAGQGLPMPDGYIAGIAAAHGFTVATRDTAPFHAAGLKVIDPWAAAP